MSSHATRRPLADHFFFAGQAWRDLRTTGSVAPSSRHLCAELTAPLRTRGPGAWRVVELGAGTGCVSRLLTAHQRATDALTLVERNPAFAAVLRERFPGAHVMACDAAEAMGQVGQVDFVVSGLPFANLPPDAVRRITGAITSRLAPGGVVTYFEYLGGAGLASVSGSADRSETRTVMADFRAGYRARSAVVARNLPPARVWRLARHR